MALRINFVLQQQRQIIYWKYIFPPWGLFEGFPPEKQITKGLWMKDTLGKKVNLAHKIKFQCQNSWM